MKGVKNPQDEIEGSNPSPGAYFEGIGEVIDISATIKSQ
jgi:hypothetical protein